MSLNQFCFTGNLGNPAEQRFTGEGKSVVGFSVAVKSGYGERATTTWVKCSMWGKAGEAVLPYLTKGQMVACSGELSLREYQNKDGSKGFSLEVNVNSLTLCGGKSDQKQESPRAQKPTPSNPNDALTDDIPW